MADTHNDDSEALRYLRALGDPDRLKIVQLLRAGPKSVSDVCRELASPMANVSHHLHALKDAGVVSASKRGRNVIYRLDHVVETGDAGTHVLDFGCCRIEFGPGREEPSVSMPGGGENQALSFLNRVLGRQGVASTPTVPRQVESSQGRRTEIVNASFERPVTPFFDTAVTGWEKLGDPNSTGVFRNFPDDTPIPGSRFVQNAEGEQLATVAARKGSGLFQSLPTARYEPGVTYTLSVGIGVSSVQPPTADGDVPATLRLALTYHDGAGKRLEAAGVDVSAAQLESARLTRVSVQATVTASSAFASQPMGVLLSTEGNTPAHAGHFILDDVAVTG